MRDWLKSLSPNERAQWDEWVQRVRSDVLPKIDESALFISLAPQGEPDIKFAVELGLAILLDKPILVVAHGGRPVPERLRRIADRVVETDIHTEAGQEAIRTALQEVRP